MDMDNGELASVDKLILSLNKENIQGDIDMARSLISQRNEMQNEMETNKKQVQAIMQSMKQVTHYFAQYIYLLFVYIFRRCQRHEQHNHTTYVHLSNTKPK